MQQFRKNVAFMLDDISEVWYYNRSRNATTNRKEVINHGLK